RILVRRLNHRAKPLQPGFLRSRRSRIRQAPANSGGSPAFRDEGGDVRRSRSEVAVEALQGLETHDRAVSDCDETTDAMGTNNEPLRKLRAGQRSVDRGP